MVSHHHRSRLPIIVVDFSYKVKLNGGITAPISYELWLYSSSGRVLVHNNRQLWSTILLAALTLLMVACGSPIRTATFDPAPTPAPAQTPTVIRDTQTIPAGTLVSWDVSGSEECRYHFTVRQTGSLGSVDIEFQGQRYTEKDGVFYGDSFTLSNGYSLNTAKVVDLLRQSISQSYGMDESILPSALRHLTRVRNICAHHERLWDLNLTTGLKVPNTLGSDPETAKAFNRQARDKVYNAIVMITYLMEVITPNGSWPERFLELKNEDSYRIVSEGDMGFPANWADHAIWQRHPQAGE